MSSDQNNTENNTETVSNSDLKKILLAVKTTSEETNRRLDDHVKKNNERITKVEQQAKSSENKVNKLEKRFDELEKSTQSIFFMHEKTKQQQLQYNIAIMGVPLLIEEDLPLLLRDVCSTLGVDINEDDVVNVRRIPNSKSNIIIAKFSNMTIKGAIMVKKEEIDVHGSDLLDNVQPDSENNFRVYINHHLTPYYSQLLMFGRNAVKEKSIHSCWITANGLLVRFEEKDNPHVFTSIGA